METETQGLEEAWRQSPEWVDTADQAKLVRKALKRAFPGQKFSVRLSRYSGGSSVRVSWTDGPTTKAVDAVVSPFEGGGFDGMVDLGFYSQSWLMPDGSVTFASTRGTEGSRGSVPGVDQSRPNPDARLVQFSGRYVFADRELSDRAKDRLRGYYERHYRRADWQSDFEWEQAQWRMWDRATFTNDGLMHVEKDY